MNDKPLIAHVLYRLDTGGMERFVVTLINRTGEHCKHALICLTGFGAMVKEIESAEVPCLSLEKKPGKDWLCYFRLWRALRALKPDVVHTYNIGALDVAPIAKLAGVRCVVHAERGRDAADPRGENRKYRRMRRWLAPFIARFLAVSRDLQGWLLDDVGIDESKVKYIPNGIDTERFDVEAAPHRGRRSLGDFAPDGTILIVTVGRLDAVKDQVGLVRAFGILRDSMPGMGERLRLAIAGEGNERQNIERQVAGLHLDSQVRLLGKRDDVAALLAECDIFALSSIAEGMPGVLLEAMASRLPVVATDVGGVGEVVVEGTTGMLVPAGDAQALAKALGAYCADEALRCRHGEAGRARVAARFGLNAMLSAYTALYDELLGRQGGALQSRVAPGLAGHGEP